MNAQTAPSLDAMRNPDERRRIYLDHQATTPVDPLVLQGMLPYFSDIYGNAASRQHSFGLDAEAAVEHARRNLLRMMGASAGNLVFTSGATEACNLAIKGIVQASRRSQAHIVTAATEHHAVLDTIAHLQAHGVRATILPVDARGHIDPARLTAAITSDTVLVSIMHANNEIGTVHDIAEVGRLCRERGVLFHTDATQSFGHIPFDVDAMSVDLASFSAHKLYGPKGIGALYVAPRAQAHGMLAQMHGGGHEAGWRSGTVNVPGVVGFHVAARIAMEVMGEETARVRDHARTVVDALVAADIPWEMNGDPVRRLPGTLNLRLPGVRATTLLSSLREFALSTGSACSSAKKEPSHVLAAIGIARDATTECFRMSAGRFTSPEEIAYFCDCLIEAVRTLRRSPALPA